MKLKLLIGVLMLMASVSANAGVVPVAIHQGHLLLTLLSFFGLGLLLAFTPCVLPMIPILSAILVGQQEQGAKRACRLSLVFVLSMAVTYALAGMLAGYLGSTVQTLMQQPWIIVSFSLIFVFMALSMFGYVHLSMPAFIQLRVNAANHRLQAGSYVGVAAMGVLSTLIASPCVTAPLISVLTYIGQTGSAVQGGLILFVLALGMGAPLVLFGLGQAAFLPKAGVWMDQVRKLFGVLMLGLAIWMISRILPGVTVMFLWSGLIIVSAVAFGALDFHADKRLPPVFHGASVLALVYGVFLLAGAASGHEDMLNPLLPAYPASMEASASAERPPSSLFTYIDTLPKLKQKLATAAAQHQPVMIEFFATWCPYCKGVDKEVLSDQTIRKNMKSFMTLRVDVSERNPALAKLMEAYDVMGVPTMVFIDKNGKVVDSSDLNEEITRSKLQGVLEKLA